MNTDTRELEARIEALERKLEAVTGYCEDLEDRITTMAVAKISEARFPYWNWQLCRGMSTEERRRLSFVLATLDARAEGVAIAEELQKPLEGVSLDILYGDEPIEAAEARGIIKAVTGMKHDAGIVDLLQAVQGQGMFGHLCRFLLGTTAG